MDSGPDAKRKCSSTAEEDTPSSTALRFRCERHHPKGGFMFGNLDASCGVVKRSSECHGSQNKREKGPSTEHYLLGRHAKW